MKPSLIRSGLQLFVGGILIASALGKSIDVPGFLDVLRTYRFFAEATLWPTALAVIAVEAVVGVWIVSGWRLARAAWVAGLLNLGYTLWMTLSLARGLDLENCGCYGVFFPQPLRWYSPLEDLVLVAACVGLWRLSRKGVITSTGPDSPR